MICTYEVDQNHYQFKLSGDVDTEYWNKLMQQFAKSLTPKAGEVIQFTIDCRNLNKVSSPENNINKKGTNGICDT